MNRIIKNVVDYKTENNLKTEKDQLLNKLRDAENKLKTLSRDLEIEASLEKVRQAAMAMKEPSDMLEVCKIISEQLELLQVKEIRNVQTAIFYESKGIYLNYEYYRLYDKSIITEVEYNSQPDVAAFVNNMLKDSLAYFTRSFDRSKLKEWIEYQKNSNQFVDPKLNESESLHYYFYSVGQGALGISTYNEQLSEDELELLKRFRNVFAMAYRRFVDIEKAIEQAREAQVEAALEKVRGSAMAMNNSIDLSVAASLIFTEVRRLGIYSIRCGVVLLSRNTREALLYAATNSDNSENDSLALVGKINMAGHYLFDQQYEHWLKNENYFTELTNEEIKNYYKALNSCLLVPALPNESNRKEYGYYFAFSEGLFYTWTVNAYTEDEINILNRFNKIIDLTFRRYFDIKNAEAQAREAKIETSLERIRTRAIGMNKPDDLLNICEAMFSELKTLGFDNIRNSLITIFNDEKGFFYDYDYSDFSEGTITRINYNSHPIVENFLHQIKSADDAFAEIKINGERLQEWNQFRISTGQKEDTRINNIPALYYYFYSIGVAAIGISTYESISEEKLEILKKFRNVFDFAYRRYSDVALAEEQAKEAKIEAALERIRSRSLAMHNSNELVDASDVFFQQLTSLGIETIRTGVSTFDKENETMEVWSRSYTEGQFTNKILGVVPIKSHIFFEKCFAAWKQNKNYFIYELKEEEIRSYYQSMSSILSYPEKKEYNTREYFNIFFFPEGSFNVVNRNPLSDEEINIMMRFAKVFGLMYRRFLDLQKAEVQAREAKIETALERVRARTMGMQHSDELSETAYILFQQFKNLGENPIQITIGIFIQEKNSIEFHITGTDGTGSKIERTFMMDIDEPILINKIYSAWEKGEKSVSIELTGTPLRDWVRFRNAQMGVPDDSHNIAPEEKRTVYASFFSKGMLSISKSESFSDETKSILDRFAGVFDLTYTRFLDLKNAEAQAREAKIEAALERIRTKAMAMRSSNDYNETIRTLYYELSVLSVTPRRCGVGIIDRESRITELSTYNTSDKGDSVEVLGRIKLERHPVLENIYDNWITQTEYHPVLRGKEIKEYYDILLPQISFPDFSNDLVHFGYFFYFRDGALYTWTKKELSDEEIQIYRRFVSVFSLTYRRYIDLIEAERRTAEALKQASMDRVRAEIASLRNVEDLNRITPIIWRELSNLNVPFIRCGVFIVDEQKQLVQVFLTTPEGKALGFLNLPINVNSIITTIVEQWRKCKICIMHWNRDEFVDWTKTLMQLGQVQNSQAYQGAENPPEELDLHFVPFRQGMLYVGNTSPLPEQKLELVRSLSEAFSIAYARYEDFINLEEAKANVEATLKELKSAQAQLIHSEKMASLGELTAGIAHEIKNPLNFVNNFSELSRSLLEDIKAELEKDNKEEVKEILNDLDQNLERINQHGKRADAIVKGMLLHSRGTSGDRILTNVNDLLDQFVSLAYHGMKAQDKEFNITIEKNYDESIAKINIVPQDISRVFLNIINNACYAANEKKKKCGPDFSPVLSVATNNLNDKIEIRIRDNGDGIPTDIRANLFTPFFTTKPSGAGTGLGLSLSYDIVVKQHGGAIKFESEEGKYTEFIITLPKQ